MQRTIGWRRPRIRNAGEVAVPSADWPDPGPRPAPPLKLQSFVLSTNFRSPHFKFIPPGSTLLIRVPNTLFFRRRRNHPVFSHRVLHHHLPLNFSYFVVVNPLPSRHRIGSCWNSATLATWSIALIVGLPNSQFPPFRSHAQTIQLPSTSLRPCH